MRYKDIKYALDCGTMVKIKNLKKPKEVIFIRNDFGDSLEFVCDDGETYTHKNVEKIL